MSEVGVADKLAHNRIDDDRDDRVRVGARNRAPLKLQSLRIRSALLTTASFESFYRNHLQRKARITSQPFSPAAPPVTTEVG